MSWSLPAVDPKGGEMSLQVVRRRRSLGVGLLAAGLVVSGFGVVAPASAATTLISNGSAESLSRQLPTGWVKAGFGTNTRALTSAANGAESGSRYVRTSVSRYTSGAAWWYTPAAVVKAGGNYTFSEYYRSGSRTTLNAYFTVGTRIVGQRLTTVAASAAWKAVRVSVKVPAGATRVRFGHALTSNGYVDVDNVGLFVAAASAPPTPSTPPAPPAPPVAAASTKGLVSLTFDDGWDNQYSNAEPIMKAANMPGTFFLITSTLGTKGYMTLAQAKSLQTDGAAEIGSHTVSHVDLTTLTPAKLDSELLNSKNTLEKTFGPITSLAYPYGANNATVQAAAAKYYTSARSTAGLSVTKWVAG
jgi:hypothetical protein